MTKLKTNKCVAVLYKIALCAILAFGVFTNQAAAATITVSNTGDCNVIGCGSLRAAILEANASAGVPDTIVFGVPALSVITPASPLPTITDQVDIGSGSRVELNGATAGATAYGLRISAANCVVQGMAVTGFQEGGIRIDGAANNTTIQGVSVGTNLAGTTAIPNVNRGILVVGTTGNTIGGGGIPNVISGNFGRGIEITGGGSATIRQNMIGTNAAGTADLGNTSHGILIANSSGSTVGGTTAADRNVISGNTGDGIQIAADFNAPASNNTVSGNYIGVNVSGNTALPNSGSGVVVQGASNIIGGTSAGARNVISGNSANGVSFSTAFAVGNSILGNYIGVGANGTTSIGNVNNGVQIASGASGNTVGGVGVTVGQCDGACNVIANNGNINAISARAGIYLDISADNGNAIRGNRIFANFGNGIDLGTSGSNADRTDANDADTGPNNLQNVPDITAAYATTGLIVGTLNSTPNTTFAIDFYRNDDVTDTLVTSEGRTYIGTTTITTPAGGTVNFSFTAGAGVIATGTFVTAMATATTNSPRMPEAAVVGDTSEIADPQLVAAAPPTAAVAPISGRLKRADGAGIAGASLTLVDAQSGETFYATTDETGAYSFAGVSVGKSYIVTPLALGYSFNPTSKVFSLLEELTNVDFVGIKKRKIRKF